MLGGADNPNGELPSYITGADMIDTLKSVRRLFSNLVTASCLRLSAGVIEELPVNDGDIMTFMQICKSITVSVDC
ncbi:hypothetical protein A6C84_004297 [Escherichia coli]